MTDARAGRQGTARVGGPETPAGPATAITPALAIPAGRVMERGRAKAHRPLPREVRRAAMERGLAAYGRGAWYLAHEELEPAWMGTDDPAERALLSGLIKLAAAYVHAARGNPLGVRTNLRGARERLATSATATTGAAAAAGAGPAGAATVAAATVVGPAGAIEWIDLPMLLVGVDDRLARIEALCEEPRQATIGDGDAGAPVPSHDVAGPVGRFRGTPVAIPPLPLPRKPA